MPAPHDDFALDGWISGSVGFDKHVLAFRLAAQQTTTTSECFTIAQEIYDWANQRSVKFITRITAATKQGDPTPPHYLERIGMADITMKDDEKVSIAIQAVDAKGNTVTDHLTWTSSDPSVLNLVVGTDGNSVEVLAGHPGSGSVHVTDGTINELYAFVITTANASSFVSTVGTPTKQTPQGPPAPTVVTPPAPVP